MITANQDGSYTVPAGSITVQNWSAGVASSTAESTTANNTVTAATPLTLLADVSASLSVTAQGTPGSAITATANLFDVVRNSHVLIVPQYR